MRSIYDYIKRRKYSFAESFADLWFYIKSRKKFGTRCYYAGSELRIDCTKNLALVFNCGLGDAIYTLPLLKKLSSQLNERGLAFNGFVEEQPSINANPAVYDLLVSIGLFDRLEYFRGTRCAYWKYHDWSSLEDIVGDHTQILPVVYKRSRSNKNRVDIVCRQFSLGCGSDWPTIRPRFSLQYKEFLYKLHNYQHVIFAHFDTRSGNYRYPHIKQLIECLKKDGAIDGVTAVVLLTNEDFSQENTYLLDPREMPISDLIELVRVTPSSVIAVNSFMWPVAQMLRKRLIGIQVVDSDDANQFYFEGAFIITPSSFVFNHIERGYLARESVDYKIIKKEGRHIVYFPESLSLIISGALLRAE